MTPFVTRRGPALCLTSFAGGVVVHFSFPCELVSSSNGHQISSVSQHPKLLDFKDFTKMDELMNNVFYVLYIYTHYYVYMFSTIQGFQPQTTGQGGHGPSEPRTIWRRNAPSCSWRSWCKSNSRRSGDRAMRHCVHDTWGVHCMTTVWLCLWFIYIHLMSLLKLAWNPTNILSPRNGFSSLKDQIELLSCLAWQSI